MTLFDRQILCRKIRLSKNPSTYCTGAFAKPDDEITVSALVKHIMATPFMDRETAEGMVQWQVMKGKLIFARDWRFIGRNLP